MKNGNEIQIADYEIQEKQEINLKDYWDRILKRKGTVLAVALGVFALGAFWTFIQKPVFTAKSQLLIEKEPNILSFDQVLQIEAMRDDFYQTQYRLLSGRGLADTVIEQLKLYENPEFVGKSARAKKSSGPDDHVFREGLIDDFLERLAVRPVRLTRLVDISFSAKDPRLAADCVNALSASFIDLNINMKYAATEQATTFLSEQIQGLQAEIQQKENQLQGFEAEANIVALSDNETTVIDRLSRLNTALTEAQIERTRKEAIWTGLKDVGPDYVPEAINNPLIQRLREDYVRLKREYQKMEERFRPDYPELQRTKVEMESARKSLADETKNLATGAYSEYQSALNKERLIGNEFNGQKDAAFKMNSSAVLYNGLKVEIQNKKMLLDTLLRRESETGVEVRLKGLRTSNIRVVDRARVPVRPSSPNKKRNLILALLLGLSGGVGLAFLFDFLDNSIKTSEDVEKYASLPTLGVVPRFSLEGANKAYSYARRLKTRGEPKLISMGEGSAAAAEAGFQAVGPVRGKTVFRGEVERVEAPMSIELVPHFFPDSRLAESYRTIRTSLLLSSADRPVKTIAMTSAMPGEGKTVSAANLAVTLAQSGKTVLIVDADLRRPRLHRVFKVKNTVGLTTFLTDSVEISQVIKSTEIPNLSLVNSGPIPPNPAELLGSEKMTRFIKTMRDECDFIIFDLPPMAEISDALVLGAKVDGLVLVVWGDKTSRETLKKVRERLDLLKVRTLGVIINNVDMPYRKYSYYMDSYYHQSSS
ncbi:MAG: GumC family protein [Candidatus Aminicenantales bacterium]